MSDRVILCYGDSNTYGWNAETGARFAPDVRWPGVLAAELGAGWRVIEEGLGGRTTVHDDPLLPHANGLTYLVPCLRSHAPLDVVVLFLGTNDFKPHLGLRAADVAQGVRTLVEELLASETGPGQGVPRVLVLGLPRLGRVGAELGDVPERWAELPPHLEQLSRELGVELLDLGGVTAYSDVDGFHLDADGHAAVGRAVAQVVATGPAAA